MTIRNTPAEFLFHLHLDYVQERLDYVYLFYKKISVAKPMKSSTFVCISDSRDFYGNLIRFFIYYFLLIYSSRVCYYKCSLIFCVFCSQNGIAQSSTADLNGFFVTSEDDFEVVSMYGRPPIIPGQSNSGPYMLPYPVNPTSNVSYQSTVERPYQNNLITNTAPLPNREPSHPLEGVPFKLAPALEVSSTLNQDPIYDDVKKTLERVKNLLNSKDFTYDCTLERNFLRENRSK